MIRYLCIVVALYGTLCRAADNTHGLSLPPGFRITVFARIADARSLALASDGTVFVGTRRAGQVHALRDIDGDGRADRHWVLARGLQMPNGVAWHKGSLYVAETHRIWRYDAILKRLDKPPRPTLIYDRLPRWRHHGWRYLAVDPRGRLTVSVGAPCNVCRVPGTALILSMRRDGSDVRVIARGVRNSVGFDWHPVNGRLWFSDNGRDWLGDDEPADEINRLDRPGQHFGFPWCHGGDTPDPQFGKQRHCREFTPPALRLQAHTAPLGVRFYTGRQFPRRYHNTLFVAQHGSWNRSIPVGYRILALTLHRGKVVGKQVFASGWLRNDKIYGRPVDLLVMHDGSLLVSDDHAGLIYRISYQRSNRAMDSTCAVCGNISMTPALSRR